MCFEEGIDIFPKIGGRRIRGAFVKRGGIPTPADSARLRKRYNAPLKKATLPVVKGGAIAE